LFSRLFAGAPLTAFTATFFSSTPRSRRNGRGDAAGRLWRLDAMRAFFLPDPRALKGRETKIVV
jgi:hypothetical protein